MRGELGGRDEDVDPNVRVFTDEMTGRRLRAGCFARLPIMLSWQ